jgi:hypothetical protein
MLNRYNKLIINIVFLQKNDPSKRLWKLIKYFFCFDQLKN